MKKKRVSFTPHHAKMAVVHNDVQCVQSRAKNARNQHMTKLEGRKARAKDRLSARLQKAEQRRSIEAKTVERRQTAAILEEEIKDLAEKKQNSGGIKVVPETADISLARQKAASVQMKGNDVSTSKSELKQDNVQILRMLLCRMITTQKKAKKCFKALNGTKSGVLVQEEFVHLFKVLKPVLKKELKAMPCGEEANTLRQQLGLLKAFLKDSM